MDPEENKIDRSGESQDSHSPEDAGERDAALLLVQEQKARLAQALEGVASRIRAFTREMGTKLESETGRLGETAAGRVDHFAEGLRSREFTELLTHTREMARNHRLLFLLGSATAGFLVARMLQISGKDEE